MSEMYRTLKGLEELAGGSKVKEDCKVKIRALRKYFERKEGLSKNKKIALGTIGILIAAALGGTYYQFVYLPREEEGKKKKTLKFVFDTTRKPSTSFANSTDTRDLAAAFDYIQFLDANSTVIRSIEFNSGDEAYLREGWYPLERWGDMGAAWARNNSAIVLELPEEAHFLRFKANSIGRTNYGDSEAEFKELMANPNGMKIYLNGKLVDQVPLYGRMQIHYANLRPDLDSDGDGIINRLDINPRIPNPKPVNTDVNVGAYYLTGWGLGGQGLSGRTQNWDLGTPFHSLLGNYSSNDPDVVDWHIKWAVEGGVRTFLLPYTKPLWGWENNLEDGLLRAKFLPYINFLICFNPPSWSNSTLGINSTLLEKFANETVGYIARNYYEHPSYFKINNRPLLMLLWASGYYDRFGPEKFDLFISVIRDSAIRSGYYNYLVGDVISSWIGDDENSLNHAKEVIDPFDAISAYAILDAGEKWEYDERGNVHLVKPYDTMVEGYTDLSKWWSTQAKKYSKKIIPPLTTGFDNSIMYEKGIDNWLVVRTKSTFEGYKRMCEGIKPFIDPELKMVVGGAWNEFQEGWAIEPTKEFRSSYLDVLYDVFGP